MVAAILCMYDGFHMFVSQPFLQQASRRIGRIGCVGRLEVRPPSLAGICSKRTAAPAALAAARTAATAAVSNQGAVGTGGVLVIASRVSQGQG